MSEKTFLIKMAEKRTCSLTLDGAYGYKICGHADASFGYTCQGNLKNRPVWCPLVEHDIGMCHIKYKEESNRGEI